MEGIFFLFYAHVLGVMYILYRILTLGGVDYFSVKSLKMMTVLYFISLTLLRFFYPTPGGHMNQTTASVIEKSA